MEASAPISVRGEILQGGGAGEDAISFPGKKAQQVNPLLTLLSGDQYVGFVRTTTNQSLGPGKRSLWGYTDPGSNPHSSSRSTHSPL